MFVEVLTLVAGVILVLALAKVIINYSLKVAEHYGLSGTFVGLTLLSIGTSIPEIMGHVIGSVQILRDPSLMQTVSSLVVGASTGSDIFQQSFILGSIGIIGTIVVLRKNLVAELGGLITAAVLVLVFSWNGFIGRVEGAVLVLGYLIYLGYLREKTKGVRKALYNLSRAEVAGSVFVLLASFVVMGFVTDRVLGASRILVEVLPISASFFGVVLLGVASALPELTTSLLAVLRGKKGMTTGILIGSNITNPMFGIGFGALISGYTIPRVVTTFDLPVKIGTGLLIFYFLWRREDLAKWEGALLICLFLVYLFFRQWLFPVDF